ncbi:MAG: cation:proton antiporter, partial [Deltaproteobacteria bacterium]|nr:cation:proton antiporter [Deltaproteobacteria bacterium]
IIFVTLGALLLLGLVADFVGHKTRLPRVSLLILFGVAMGPGGLDLIDLTESGLLSMMPDAALAMIGFLLGEKLSKSSLGKYGKQILCISIAVVVFTGLFVMLGLLAAGGGLVLAIVLAGLSSATDPLAVKDVVDETGSRGRLADTLLGVVAVDDAEGLIFFSLLLVAAQALAGGSVEGGVLTRSLWELLGALAIGGGLGIPMAFLSGRINPGEPSLVEALGFVLLCTGLAMKFQASYLLASMALGAVVANLAKHHSYPFHAIEGVEKPFMILFFILAGVKLDIHSLARMGFLGAVYVAGRTLGRFVGSMVGAWAGGTPKRFRHLYGPALLPQAGVAVGMALVAARYFPDLEDDILSIVIAATVLFEMAGPIGTRMALKAAKKIGEDGGKEKAAGR